MRCKIARTCGKIFPTLVALLLFSASVTVAGRCADAAPSKRVLLLSPLETSRPAIVTLISGIRAGLQANYPGRVDIVSESVGAIPPEPADFPQKVTDWIAYKYREQKFDVVLTLRPGPAKIGSELRDRCWPDASIVSIFLDDDRGVTAAPIARSTRLQFAVDNSATIRSALQMLPQTQRIAIVGGTGVEDDKVNAAIVSSIRKIDPRVEIINLSGLSLADIKLRASKLPPRTIILVGGFSYDSTGRQLSIVDVILALAPTANAPIFQDTDLAVGKGAVGGKVFSVAGSSVIVGQHLARLFMGADPASLSVVKADNSFIVDWRQIKRWNISPKTIPLDATILFRQPSALEQYRRYILSALAVLICLLIFVTVLLVERGRRQKEEKLTSAMLESLPGLAVLVSPQGEILRTNQSRPLSEILPVPAVETTQPTSYRDYLHALTGPNSPHPISAIEQVVAGSRSDATVDLPLADNQHWLEIRAIALPRPGGGSLVVHLDITQRKRAEEEQNRSREDIHHLNRVAAIGQLAGSLAHELSQPLAAILSNAQAAQRFADRPEPDLIEIKEALADITRDDRRARSIIQEMRSLMKKESGVRRPVDLNAAISSLIQILKSEVQRAGVRVELELTDGELVVSGDAGPLQQVLLNLIQNAMDAMRSLPPANRRLTITTKADPITQTAIIYVADMGPGVPPEIRAKLFEPFVTTKADGLGLGLSICHSIVTSLGGNIYLRDDQTSGTTFCVSLVLIGTPVAPVAVELKA